MDIITLSSLQITPACNLPLKSLRGGGKIVIVNLQKTPKDKKASLVIHGQVDKVIAGVMESLNLRIPSFVRIDFLQISLSQALSMDKKYVNWVLQMASVHGQKAPLPFVKSVEVSFVDCENYKEAILQNQPFKLKRRTLTSKVFEIVLKFNFSEGCGCMSTQVKIPFDFKVSTDCVNHDKDAIIQRLKDTAIQDSFSGQNAVVERMAILAPKTEVTGYAIVTNVVGYNQTSKAFEAAYVRNGNLVKRRKEGMNGTEASGKRLKRHKRKARL